MAEVQFRSAQKVYPGGFRAIHGVDLDIADGELIVIVGPSGCGKSTLLRMVAGLERISAGEILIDGEVVNDREPADRDIAMVFQNYALYPHMSVFDNMAYGLRNRGTPRDEIDRRVEEATRILELEGLLERKPRQLSGGQRQRVAMGRAIVREPKVFLFDEPLSNLDAKLRVQMRLEIKKLQAELGTTSIYVTHDQVEAMTLADRLVVMNAGNAEQIGTPLEVYEGPESVFVAGFIGSPSMNFLPAQLNDDGTAVRLAGGDELPLDGGNLSAHGGRSVTLGVRPEHLVTGEGDASHGIAHLRVDVIEALGADTLVHGHFGDDRHECTIRLFGKPVVRPGDTLPLKATADNLHVFDVESGQRLSQ
ncbi:MAG: sn-glycerol-3-phosphate import ATP-binding protein UgpC [Alphaproteobacteria bacterium]